MFLALRQISIETNKQTENRYIIVRVYVSPIIHRYWWINYINVFTLIHTYLSIEALQKLLQSYVYSNIMCLDQCEYACTYVLNCMYRV